MPDTAQPAPAAPPRAPRFTGRGWRLAMLIAITLAMCVPLVMVSLVIEDRVSYQRQAVAEVSRQWGGPVRITGPALVIPVEVERDRVIEERDGTERIETYTERAQPVLLMPEHLDVLANAVSEIRSRGIFEVPVYTVDIAMAFGFDLTRIPGVVGPRETVLWEEAVLTVAMPSTRSFSGAAELVSGQRGFDLEPGSALGQGGIQARVGDPRGLDEMRLTMGLNGADVLMFSPNGRLTKVTMASGWPDPAFDGAFLPKEREVRPDGFEATWEIPHLAREIPQVSRGTGFRNAQFGVRFYNAVDLYQRTQRAAKYGILFIALTFLTVFLTERLSARPAHAAQIVLIGFAQCVFFLLVLSLAEQIGFGSAYLAASIATIGLIGFYGATGLGLGRWWWTLAGALVALYGVLYMILQSADYALLAGSILAFVAVALMMVMARSDDWSKPSRAPVPA